MDKLQGTVSPTLTSFIQPVNNCLSVSQVEVIGGADKYQAVCRKCYGDLMVDKENSATFRNETPQQVLPGKVVDSGVPRKLFSSLHI